MAYWGKRFDPPSGPYYKYTYKWSEPSNLAFGLGLTSRVNGIFHVNVFSPEENREGAILDLVDALVTHFWPSGGGGLWLDRDGLPVTAAGLNVTRIEKSPMVGDDVGHEGWFNIPVKIRFFSNF